MICQLCKTQTKVETLKKIYCQLREMNQNIDRAFKHIDKSAKDMEMKTRKGTKPRQTTNSC